MISLASLSERNTGEVDPTSMSGARGHYIKGLEAEKHRLAFFGPYENDTKRLLALAVMEKNDQRTHGVSSITKHVQQTPEKRTEPNQGPASSMSCTPEEVRELIRDTGDLNISQFKNAFQKKYGRKPHQGKDLARGLEQLATSQLFLLTEKKKSFWLSLPPAPKKKEPAAKKKRVNQSPTTEKGLAKRIKVLLTENGDIYVGQIKQLYETKYGTPFLVSGGKVATRLRQLEKLGMFSLEYRSNKSELWLSLRK